MEPVRTNKTRKLSWLDNYIVLFCFFYSLITSWKIDKLIHFGADILQPIAFGQKRSVGTVCDYAYYMYNPDVKLAQTPYHSLSIAERATHNARKELLEHLGRRFREKAMERTSLFESGIDFNSKIISYLISSSIVKK